MRAFDFAGLALSFSGLVLAACGTEPRPIATETAPQSRAVGRNPVSAAPSASAYVANAGAIDLFEVRAGELALQRARSGGVRDFANNMVRAHRGMAAQLSSAGRRLNLLPSATLPVRFEAMLEQLQSTSDFDALYRRQQLAVHQEALSLHSGYAAAGTSPTLRAVAAAMKPLAEHHLRMLRYVS